MLIIKNKERDVVSTNYWESEFCRKGYLYLSLNAGAFRMLVPPGMKKIVKGMKTAKVVIVSRGFFQGRNALELLFEDYSDDPYSVHLVAEQMDKVPIDDDVDRPGEPPRWTFSAWGPKGKLLERPARYRIVETLPCLKRWEDEDVAPSQSAERQMTDPQQIIDKHFARIIIRGKSYPRPLPAELQPWYVYTLDGGHSIICALEKLWEPGGDPAKMLVPIPVKTVLRSYEMREGYPLVKIDYDHLLGAVIPDGDEEFAIKSEMADTPTRLRRYLSEMNRKYPDFWATANMFRRDKGKPPLPDWPDWCFVPISGAFAYFSQGKPENLLTGQDRMEVAALVGPLTGLAAWRATQGIYRFHDEVLMSVWESTLSGDLPVDLLFRLPEWCVYVETPARSYQSMPLYGFFAYLEYDVKSHSPELRLLLDVQGMESLHPIILHLDRSTIAECFQAAVEHTLKMDREYQNRLLSPNLQGMSKAEFEKQLKMMSEAMAQDLEPMISVLLYICSAAEDTRDAGGSLRRPKKARPKKIKGGEKYFPLDKPIIWETGYRMGAALVKAKEKLAAAEPQGGTHTSSPIPHIRKAHWHTFLTGSRKDPDKRGRVVKWLPPIPVGMGGELGSIIPTIHLVK